MNDKNIFPQGIWLNSPPENAPDFVLGKIDINPDEFCKWLKENEDAKGKVRLDVLKSKQGKTYLKLNGWKPEQKEQEATQDTYEPRDKFQF